MRSRPNTYARLAYSNQTAQPLTWSYTVEIISSMDGVFRHHRIDLMCENSRCPPGTPLPGIYSGSWWPSGVFELPDNVSGGSYPFLKNVESRAQIHRCKPGLCGSPTIAAWMNAATGGRFSSPSSKWPVSWKTFHYLTPCPAPSAARGTGRAA